MDNLTKLDTIINIIFEGGSTIAYICKLTGLSFDEVKEIILYALKSDIASYWQMELYNGDTLINETLVDRDGDDEEYTFSFLEKNIFPETEIIIWCRSGDIKDINDLTTPQRWALYDLLNQSDEKLVSDLKKKVLNLYEEEFKERNIIISERRLIKQDLDIFGFEQEFLINLYKLINEENCADIRMKDGEIIYNTSPVRVFYNDDLKRWYLEYIYKRDIHVVRLDNIDKVIRANGKYKEKRNLKQDFGIGKKTIEVKIRVYDEKNARDRAVRFLSRKNINSMEKIGNYYVFTVNVSDINLFKRWLREMGSSVVVLEPLTLKQTILKEIEDWMKIYE